jgi:hypothetical protein
MVKGNYISRIRCLWLLGGMKRKTNDRLCFVAKFKLPYFVYKESDCPALKQLVYLLA